MHTDLSTVDFTYYGDRLRKLLDGISGTSTETIKSEVKAKYPDDGEDAHDRIHRIRCNDWMKKVIIGFLNDYEHAYSIVAVGALDDLGIDLTFMTPYGLKMKMCVSNELVCIKDVDGNGMGLSVWFQ